MGPDGQREMSWFECAEDATLSALHKSKIKPVAIALKLWPAMKPDSAYARLMGALKRSRPEKLTTDEHVLIAHETQQYDYLYYVEAQCHHAGSRPVEPAEEAVELQRAILKGQEELKVLYNRLAANSAHIKAAR